MLKQHKVSELIWLAPITEAKSSVRLLFDVIVKTFCI